MPDAMLYSTISYDTTVDPGVATILVVGCNTNTELLVNAGIVEDDHSWRNTLAQVIWTVLDAVDPNSPNYNVDLDADAGTGPNE